MGAAGNLSDKLGWMNNGMWGTYVIIKLWWKGNYRWEVQWMWGCGEPWSLPVGTRLIEEEY